MRVKFVPAIVDNNEWYKIVVDGKEMDSNVFCDDGKCHASLSHNGAYVLHVTMPYNGTPADALNAIRPLVEYTLKGLGY